MAIFGNHIYVSDQVNNNIVQLDLSGNYVRSWGGRGIGNGQFHQSGGMAVDGSGNVYVADIEQHRIQVFDGTGTFIKMIGERGTGNGQPQFPSAVAVDSSNQWLYVTDDDNDRILKFTLNGGYLDQWGCDSTGTTGLRYPTKMAVDDSNGWLYVVDSEAEIEAARELGIRSCAVSFGMVSKERLLAAGPDILLEPPAELARWMDELT